MLLVTINRNPNKITDVEIGILANVMPIIVRHVLSMQGAQKALSTNEVEVIVRDFCPLDINTGDIEISISTHYHPELWKNIDERCKQIADYVKIAFPQNSGFVRILPVLESSRKF